MVQGSAGPARTKTEVGVSSQSRGAGVGGGGWGVSLDSVEKQVPDQAPLTLPAWISTTQALKGSVPQLLPRASDPWLFIRGRTFLFPFHP